MKITFLGAAQTVTGSRILFEHNGFKGMVDCGLFQGPKELRQLNWLDQPELKDVRCVLLTHVHVDHSGYLPRLYKHGFRGPIFCSKASADLLPVMLMDAAKLQEEDARFANRSKYSHHNPALPLYDSSDAQGCRDLIYSRPWLEWKELAPGLSFRFIRSGHILGSGCVQISFSNGDTSRIITFSGDLGSSRSEILRDAETILETDYLVIESTYGNRPLSRDHISAELAQVVNEVYGRGGTLVIPAFSVGRTQDLLLLLENLKDDKKIENVPIYVDSPMSHAVTSIYLKHLGELKQEIGNRNIEEALSKVAFKPVLSADESMLLCMSTEPKIVISASGMLQGGRILHHLRTKLPHEKNGVLFVGFQSKGTKGRLLKEGIPTLRIHHQEISVDAQIYSIEGLSAHADRQELLNWMNHLQKPPRMTFINHGEIESSQALQNAIQTELKWNSTLIPAMGQVLQLD